MNHILWGNDSDDYHQTNLDFTDEIEVMRQKEVTTYKCGDYVLRRELQNKNISTELVLCSESTDSQQSDDKIKDHDCIDASCRIAMCEWCYRVVDYFGARRELVEISMNYLDRLLDKFNCDRTAYKLAAITSMYLAIKLFNQKNLTLRSLSMLSRGEFSVANIEEMEKIMLQALSWNLYPPTSFSFIYQFYSLLPSISDHGKQTILQLSCFFAELTVMEYSFVTSNASVIAFSAVLNAIDGLHTSLMSEENKISYIHAIENILGVDSTSKVIMSARKRILSLYAQSTQFELLCIKINKQWDVDSQESDECEMYEKNSHEMSPVCVIGT